MILILDFGSQTTHLIARRIRDLGVKVKILPGDDDFQQIEPLKTLIKGIILSGGPNSVYEKNAPLPDERIYKLGVPILGICYGLQATCHLLGGKVNAGRQGEFGPAKIKLRENHPLFFNSPQEQIVWLSHGDEVKSLPKGFELLASTKVVKNTVVANEMKKIYGLQFHPEVQHTKFGKIILKNFLQKISKIKLKKKNLRLTPIIKGIKKKIGSDKVVAAVSGGVDSTVAASLVAKAIGRNLIPIYLDNGLMRRGTKEEVRKIFKENFGIKPIIIRAKSLFLKKLKGVANPEKKRKVIGKLYVKFFEKEAKKNKGAKWLLQGTIYSDVIESQGTKHAAKIKSHHNVAGLPKRLNLKLLEPLRNYYKDEVRKIGKKLKLSKEVVYKQPFPGPGQAIRIIGEVTKERLAKQQQADQIVLEELKKAGWYKRVFQSFPVLTGIKSTAVKGDACFYGEVVALRIYQSEDIMTASWIPLPSKLLQKISSRIVNEVDGVSRVVYDITTKPPATMEWE